MPLPMRRWFVLLILVLAGCGAGEGAPWVLLNGTRPTEGLDAAAWSEALGCGVRPDDEEGGVWLEWELGLDRWWVEGDGSHSSERPLVAGISRAPGGRLEMEVAGKPLAFRPVGMSAFGKVEEGAPLQEGEFGLEGSKLVWRLPDVRPKPRQVTLREFVPRGEARGGRLWIAHERVSGRGLSVWPGERWVDEVRVPPESALRFFCAVRGGGAAETVRFGVRLDGETLWDLERTPGADEDRWVEVPLPPGGKAAAELELFVEGPPALTAFVDPAIGPARPDELSGRQERPNVCIFLADTFRADNLEVYGGAGSLTPALNALARESLVFERAWGTSSWTLPSQASLFTGLHPPEHSATRREHILPADLETLAEVLSRSGYRTAAVTDGAYLSRRFQMNQGFDWFLERDPSLWDLDTTLERSLELLETADGRPIFLFVQTYRAHTPYRIGPDESRTEYHDFLKTIYRQLKRDSDIPEEERLRLAEAFRDFYHQGLADLDTEFGRWWEKVRALATWNPGYLLFTSDHGEAFYEHGKLEHGNGLHEEITRVPLLIHGPGMEPGIRPVDASLIDLPRTLANLVGVAPSPDWHGVDLLADTAGRREGPIAGFWLTRAHHHVALVDGTRKVVGHADPERLLEGELLYAHDLAEDPGETRDVRDEAGWPTEKARVHAEFLRRILEAAPESPQTLSGSERAEALAELEGIGYTGS